MSTPTGTPRNDGRPATKGELRFYAAVKVVLVGFAKLWFRVSATGKEHVPKDGAFIFTPVHRSNIDFLLLLICTDKRIRYLSKDSIFVGVWDRIFTALGAIPVTRGTADREALQSCITVLQAGDPVVIFPEGTRQSGPVVQELFDGAAFVQSRTGVPIVPVGIGGSETAMPKGAKFIKPHKIRLVVGPALAAPEADGPKARRAAIKARTAELHPIIQDLFDQAQVAAGTPNT
ncbi:1-acyl-sn-glycerol-3-phosphate acyltransferase [Aquihabitans sp. G128]|uniref:lysophospholipid acyltransferase family protein n=1 Tax=Aquihabitans sp. G128 TaxID=2849779 RepID=UPI001C227AE4|nr:lysophospholipid acyltransferase family protein [Aquihabitans sp. G128]QXC62013.1 1-acyl-sn-glycerol-3-phosphate acyltransferase [Aquihabitans sp. G128]